MRLGILSSHPIQYQTPWFRALAERVDLAVYFAHRQSASEQADAGFGVSFDWDVDLLSGYKHYFLKNVSPNPSVNEFAGCDTPEIGAIISGQKSEVIGQSSTTRRRFDAFIIMGWYLKSYRQAARACRRAGVPVLVCGDSQLRTPRPFLKRLVMEVRQRVLLTQFDAFLSPGQRHREYLEHYGVPPEKTFFAPHFVDNEWFAARAAEIRDQRSEIRKKWGIPEDAFVPLFCGKFIPKKRPLDLVEAARLLITDNSLTNNHPLNIHLLFVGSGELAAELRQSCNVVFDAESIPPINEKPITDNEKPFASFVGFKNQTELSACYVAADVLVLPSDGGETWGLVVNEAMACGTPAIVSDAVGCAPDLIAQGETGFTFPVGNRGSLAARLTRLASLKERGHAFDSALESKLRAYNVNAAVEGTVNAVKRLHAAPGAKE